MGKIKKFSFPLASRKRDTHIKTKGAKRTRIHFAPFESDRSLSLERQLRAELKLAWQARSRRQAERRRGRQRSSHSRELRFIENVERFRTELQLVPVLRVEVNVLRQRQVRLVATK